MRIRFIIISILASMTMSMQAQEIRMPQKPKKKAFKDITLQEKGVWFAVEAGAGSTAESGMKNAQIATATFTGGYRFSEYLKVGAGVGGGYYFNNSDIRSASDRVNIPVYAHVRGNMMTQQYQTAVPYWAFSVGARFKDGAFFSPAVGFRFGEHRSSFIMSVKYEYGEIKLMDGKKWCSSFHLSFGYEM